ncbi:MAG: SH3 domain-containing protein [Chloroflexota bacterium]
MQEETTKRSTGLLIAGFALVVILVIAGLFLIFRGNGTDAEEVTVPDRAGDTAVSSTESEVGTAEAEATTATGTSMVMVDTPPTAPAGAVVKGDVYNVTYGAAAEPVALPLPDAVDNVAALDVVSWDGTAWTFLPSHFDATTAQFVVDAGYQPQTVALIEQATDPAALVVGAELLPTQEFVTDLLPVLNEVAAGTLTLTGNGVLSGDVVAVPSGPYSQLMRVTNTGIIIDTDSLTALLGDTNAQATHVSELASRAAAGNFAGVLLDYQGASAGQTAVFTDFVRALVEALHAQGLQLGIVLASPTGTADNWNTGGQDWVALGQLADIVYLQLPLNPNTYADNGLVDQILSYAITRVDRNKLTPVVTANAVDGLGEAFVAMSNDAALANFGDLQFVAGGESVEPETAVEVALSGTAGPLEWDGVSLTYKYSYDVSGQTHYVWLGHEASLAHRARFVTRYNLRGVMVTGLGNVTNGPGYAAALASLQGTAAAPQPTDAAIVWTVRDAEGGVLASDTGGNLTYAWDGSAAAGEYSINADFALGNTLASLGAMTVTVAGPVVEESLVQVQTTETTEEPPAEETTPTTFNPGDADAVVNTGANVRVGPGLGYGTVAGGLEAGSRVTLTGRSEDASWLAIIMPDGETEGWVFASLVTVNANLAVSDLPVKEAPPLVAANPGDGGGTSSPPPVVAPISNTGFELGGQIFGAPYNMMSYAGMTWVKRQYKWGPGGSPQDVAGMISEAHNAGFKILLSIPGAPYPNSLPDFTAYVEFLRGVASLPDPPNAIEVWNEQNINAEWPSGQIDPSSYVNNMLKPAYNAIKSANSSILVVSGAPAPTGYFGGGCGATGCDDAPYVAGMAAAGAASYMDCLGVHYNEGIISPNQTSGDPRSEHYTRYFWGMVNAYSNAIGGSRPLCFTELGFLTSEGYGSLPGNFSWAGNVTVAQQAQWLAEAASLSASSGKVRLMIVWNVDSTTWGDDPQAGYAIIRPGGSCPACETLRQVTGGR